MLFANLLKKIIKEGALRLIDATGQLYLIGDNSDPICTVRLHKKYLNYSLCITPSLTVPEAYVNGTLTIEKGTVYDFFDLASRNYSKNVNQDVFNFLRWFDPARFGQLNSRRKAKKNVSHHYDLSGELYSLFLDTDQQYSCAYFRSPEDDLEAAQFQKKQHLAAKLCLQPGQKILDIGSGWGGLGLYLAKNGDVMVNGITLSEEQHKVSNQQLV